MPGFPWRVIIYNCCQTLRQSFCDSDTLDESERFVWHEGINFYEDSLPNRQATVRGASSQALTETNPKG
jgi:hypothetical protein